MIPILYALTIISVVVGCCLGVIVFVDCMRWKAREQGAEFLLRVVDCQRRCRNVRKSMLDDSSPRVRS